jgi:hypothetical protein
LLKRSVAQKVSRSSRSRLLAMVNPFLFNIVRLIVEFTSKMSFRLGSIEDVTKSTLRRSTASVAHASNIAFGSSVGDLAYDHHSQTTHANTNSNASDITTPANTKANASDILDEVLRSLPGREEVGPEIVIADSCVKRLKAIGETTLRLVVEGTAGRNLSKVGVDPMIRQTLNG